MFQKRVNIDRMRVASPCPMNWEAMKGDDRARFCEHCSLHVYNISNLTSREVKKLIADTEGRICARLYKRSDGTVLTKDCPVGLRAIRRRVARVGGAVMTTIFSFCMSVMGQSSTQEDKSCPDGTKIVVERLQENRSRVQGVLLDDNGAVIADAKVTLVNQITKQQYVEVSNEDGVFKFSGVEVGSYDLTIQGTGLVPKVVKKIKVESSQVVNIDVSMAYDGEMTIGVVAADPMLDTDGPRLKKTVGTKQISSLPF